MDRAWLGQPGGSHCPFLWMGTGVSWAPGFPVRVPPAQTELACEPTLSSCNLERWPGPWWLLGVLVHLGDGASLVFHGRREPVFEWLESMMVRGF